MLYLVLQGSGDGEDGARVMNRSALKHVSKRLLPASRRALTVFFLCRYKFGVAAGCPNTHWVRCERSNGS